VYISIIQVFIQSMNVDMFLSYSRLNGSVTLV